MPICVAPCTISMLLLQWLLGALACGICTFCGTSVITHIRVTNRSGGHADRVDWEGIRACEALQKQGVDCNMTLLFSFAQARSCGHTLHDHAHAPTKLVFLHASNSMSSVLAVYMLRAHGTKH